MKKIVALLLALMMCVALFAACAEEKQSEATPGDTTDNGDEANPGDTTKPDNEQPTTSVPTDAASLQVAPEGAAGEEYIIVANDAWVLEVVANLTEEAKPATWVSGTSGLTGYAQGGVAYLAPEGQMVAVKEANITAYATGEIADEDIVYIPFADTEGNLVGTQVIMEYDAATQTIKSLYKTGKSVSGKLEITKNGDKFTVKIGDKEYLKDVAATEKFTTKAYDAVAMSCYYSTHTTMKSVFVSASEELIDLSLLMSDDTHDITTVGMFYDELYNINYEGYVDAYDYNGDGKIDLVVVNRPVTGKVTSEGVTESGIQIGILGDNHSYCGCGGWHTNTSIAVKEGTTLPEAAAKNDFMTVYENYTTGTYTVKAPEKVQGTLTKIEGTTVYVGKNAYTVNTTGDLPYVNGKSVTQFATDAQQALWQNAINNEEGVTLYVDEFDNVLVATLPALPTA